MFSLVPYCAIWRDTLTPCTWTYFTDSRLHTSRGYTLSVANKYVFIDLIVKSSPQDSRQGVSLSSPAVPTYSTHPPPSLPSPSPHYCGAKVMGGRGRTCLYRLRTSGYEWHINHPLYSNVKSDKILLMDVRLLILSWFFHTTTPFLNNVTINVLFRNTRKVAIAAGNHNDQEHKTS